MKKIALPTVVCGLLACGDAQAETASRWSGEIETARLWAERAIVVGGAFVYRNRHLLAGAGLGCAAGAFAGAGSAAAAGAVTGGAALAGTPQAVALGCGLGAAAGAALGQQLDRPYR